MLIVPEADKLIVEAKVQPQDIDQLQLGQTAVLRFSAFNQRTTPELNGERQRVSAPTSRRTRSTNESYYTVRIRVADGRARAPRTGSKLVPGMPVEAFVQTSRAP